ncbi:hypothetical protein [Microseira wollei]|uniref:hypothetical protein n=1 Tax=Microseira wollei TaxID=467598 RepID=UPI001CFE25D7|nr:hypothetical protein [Microseira wollei]
MFRLGPPTGSLLTQLSLYRRSPGFVTPNLLNFYDNSNKVGIVEEDAGTRGHGDAESFSRQFPASGRPRVPVSSWSSSKRLIVRR